MRGLPGRTSQSAATAEVKGSAPQTEEQIFNQAESLRYGTLAFSQTHLIS